MQWPCSLALSLGWLLATAVSAATAQNAPSGIGPHEHSYDRWKAANNAAERLVPDPTSLQYYQDAIDIAEKVAKEDSSNEAWQRLLGKSYSRMGWALELADRPEYALDFLNAALKLVERLEGSEEPVGPTRREVISLKLEIGRIHLDQGRIADAVAVISDALALAKAVVDVAPDDPANQRALLNAYRWMAALQAAQEDSAAALASRREEVAIAERLATAMPADRERAKSLADAYEGIGQAFDAVGNATDALDSLRQAIVVRQRLVEADPQDFFVRFAVARAQKVRGKILLRRGDLQHSLEAYSEMLDALRRAPKAIINSMMDELEADAEAHVGIVLAKLGRRAEAKENLLKARKTILALRALYPNFLHHWDEYAWIDRELETLK